MKPILHCKLFYINSKHLNQLYCGFELLRQKGIIDLTIEKIRDRRKLPFPELKADYYTPLLQVVINGEFSGVFDTLDGMNWVDGSVQTNLNYFKHAIHADFYFKRSFTEAMRSYGSKGCLVAPLGLNYACSSQAKVPRTLKESFRYFSKNNTLVERIYKRKYFEYSHFEQYPILNKDCKILFLTRLWDPEDVSSEKGKEERIQMNRDRIRLIKRCKEAFGDKFVGGLKADALAYEMAEELVMPGRFTRNDRFIDLIKEHNICITTTGLHGSTGWSFAEFVAASRGIVSQPLNYLLPGDFKAGRNYLSYQTDDEFIHQIQYLIDHKAVLQQMMLDNYHYYNNYLRPDSLVLNALLKVHRKINKKAASLDAFEQKWRDITPLFN